MFENPEIAKSFNKYIVRGIKNLSYFEQFSKHFVCSGQNSPKAMLNAINENLPLKVESSFAFP